MKKHNLNIVNMRGRYIQISCSDCHMKTIIDTFNEDCIEEKAKKEIQQLKRRTNCDKIIASRMVQRLSGH